MLRPTSKVRLQALRTKIRCLEDARFSARESGPPDPRAPGFALESGLHEVCPAGYLDTPSALAFLAGFLAGLERDRFILWARMAGSKGQDFGPPSPHGLFQRGLDPSRIVLTQTGSVRDLLWAMEEGLTSGAHVFGEVGAAPAYDLTASKRLNCAAQRQGAVVLALRSHHPACPSAALTRWRVRAAPSRARPWRGATGTPGLGAPCWQADLERVRGSAPATFDLEWNDETLCFAKPAALADRPARPVGTAFRAAS